MPTHNSLFILLTFLLAVPSPVRADDTETNTPPTIAVATDNKSMHSGNTVGVTMALVRNPLFAKKRVSVTGPDTKQKHAVLRSLSDAARATNHSSIVPPTSVDPRGLLKDKDTPQVETKSSWSKFRAPLGDDIVDTSLATVRPSKDNKQLTKSEGSTPLRDTSKETPSSLRRVLWATKYPSLASELFLLDNKAQLGLPTLQKQNTGSGTSTHPQISKVTNGSGVTPQQPASTPQNIKPQTQPLGFMGLLTQPLNHILLLNKFMNKTALGKFHANMIKDKDKEKEIKQAPRRVILLVQTYGCGTCISDRELIERALKSGTAASYKPMIVLH